MHAPEPRGDAARLGKQLESAAEVAAHDVDAHEVDVGDHDLGRDDRAGDLDALLEGGESGGVAAGGAHPADRAQGLHLHVLQIELDSERERALCNVDRSLLLVGEPEEVGCVREDVCRGIGGRRLTDERLSCLEMVERCIVLAPVPQRDVREHDLGLGRLLVLAHGEQSVPRGHEVGRPGRPTMEEAFRVREEDARALLVVHGPEVERGLQGARRRLEAVERERPLPCLPERLARALRELGRVATARLLQRESALVVVRHHIGEVLAVALHRLDPERSLLVPLGAPPTRDLGVGHVAHEDMVESVHAGRRGREHLLSADELLPLERSEALVEDVAREPAHAREGPEREDATEDGCILQELLLLDREAVETRRNEALHRLREREIAGMV